MTRARIYTSDLPRALVALMEGPTPPRVFGSDGCTHCPDFIGGVDLRPACHWHDWAYERGGTEEDREKADYAFFRNLVRCGVPRLRAHWMFFRVRFWGWRHFSYCCGRPTGWQLVRLLVRLFCSRYVRF